MRILVKILLPILAIIIVAQSCKTEEIEAIPDDCLVRASALNGQIIPEEYIITYRSGSKSARLANAEITQSIRNLNIDESAVEMVMEGEKTLLMAHLEANELAKIKADPAIESVEPDRIMSICSCVDVVSPRSLTWSVQKTGYGKIGQISPKVAWIIDTGIDLDHPDLNVDNTKSRSFVPDQTSADDVNGHGTHVAGIIGAKNNTVGLLGIASDVKLVALKVFNQLGEGRLSSVIAAVRHVNTNGKAGDVVNMSLGGEGVSQTLEREILTAANKGILFAIAAGNDSENVEKYSPARTNHPNVFTVSAVDSSNRFASFSNFGSSVDVAAYGVRVVSTYSNGRYATLSGTSMAAPHVAGLLLTRGVNIPKRGTAINDPDGKPDPIARE
jgi:subtilisin